ncbi:MAG: hypothetical protein ACOYXW_06995 [Actinomycetota bacterium]
MAERREAVEATRGAATGAYGDRYLAKLREDSPLIVLDASVLIAHFDSTDAHHERARTLLLGIVDEQLAASHPTLAAEKTQSPLATCDERLARAARDRGHAVLT